MAHDSSTIASDLVKEDPTFADLVEEFVAGLSDRVEGMSDALQESDFEQLKQLAHQLKGAAGGHGYPILTDVSGVLEEAACESELAKCQQSVSELQALIARVVVQ